MRKKSIFGLIIVMLILGGAQTVGACPSFGLCRIKTMKGEVVGLKKSILEVTVQDERTRRKKKFIIQASKFDLLEVGDSVRVSYSSAYKMASSIVKTTHSETTTNFGP